jgi:hypothetical protein
MYLLEKLFVMDQKNSLYLFLFTKKTTGTNILPAENGYKKNKKNNPIYVYYLKIKYIIIL